MTEHGTVSEAPHTSRARWPLLGGLAVVLLFLGLPLIFVAWIGWPDAVPPAINTGSLLVVPPSPPAGLPPDLIYWVLLSGGLALGFALGAWFLVLLLGRREGAGLKIPGLRFPLLATLGLVSLFTYALNFLLPFPLERYYCLVLVCMGRITKQDAGVALATTASILALFLLYGLAYRLCQGQNTRRWWAVVLVGALLLALVNFLVVPTTSTDVYDNVVRGRITGVYNGNPYVYAPADYPFEPFTEYISWDDATSAYGPLWETLGALLSRFAGDHLWPNVLAHKGLALVSYLLSTVLIATALRRIAPARALAGTLFFAWNPLILMEGIANAHNDLLMVALLMGSFWFLSQAVGQAGALPLARTLPYGRIWTLVYEGVALLLLTAAVLVKFVPVLFFPFFLLYLLIPERGWGRRVGLGLLLLIVAAVPVVEYYGIFWQWPAVADTFTRRAEMFRMSVPSAAVEALQIYIGEEAAMTTVREPFLWTFVLCYLWVLGRTALALRSPWRESRSLAPENRQRTLSLPASLKKAGRILFGSGDTGASRPIDILLRACLSAILLYLLLVSFWFWPWYLIWPTALLALSGDERFVIPLVIAGCVGELAHVGWNFVWYWWGVSWDTTYQMDALIVFGLVVPALVAYMILGLRRRAGESVG